MNAREYLQNFFIETGETSKFAARFFKEIVLPPYEFKEFLLQCYNVG